jgi:hypothetical protein
VRELVAKMAVKARAENLEAIDAIDLGDAYKWKIDFHRRGTWRRAML